MRLKAGVKLKDLKPQTVLAMHVAESCYKRHAGQDYEMTITSCNDSKHGNGSLHFDGNAFDSRTKDLPESVDKIALRNDIQMALGDNYDVVLEDIGGPNEHIHTEHDPE